MNHKMKCVLNISSVTKKMKIEPMNIITSFIHNHSHMPPYFFPVSSITIHRLSPLNILDQLLIKTIQLKKK